MFNLKGRTVLLAALFCNSCYAGTMGSGVDYKNKLFFGGAPIYGALSDGGFSRTNFVSIKTTTSQLVQTYEPSINSNWGYQLYLGYKIGKDNTDDVVFNYLNIHNSGYTTVTTPAGLRLVNELTQIPADGGPGLTNGVASAETKIGFQTGDIIKHSYSQSKTLPIEYSYFYGLKITGVTKKFAMNTAGTEGILAYADSIQYKNNLFGIGPKIGMGADWSLFRSFSVGGDLSVALLGGSQNSQWNEVLNSTVTNTQTHGYAAWIPLVFGGNLSAGMTLNAPKEAKFKVEGGVGGEVYLSSHLTDTFDSVKFMNNLYFTDAFIKFTYLC